MQTKLKITGNWSELKTKLQAKYPKLTDMDLTFSAGKEDELVSRLSKKLAKTEEEITDVIDDLQSKSSKTERKMNDEETERSANDERENRDTARNEKEKQKEGPKNY